MNATSFICEHSAEFVLVPFITELFAAHKQKLVPLYFWKTREGSIKSKKCDPGIPIRILSMYARRPKIDYPGQDSILVRINHRLFEHAAYLKENGIQTIIGVPRISSIMDFYVGCPCSWFTLSPDSNSVWGIDFSIDIKKNKCNAELPLSVKGPLEEKNILNLLNNSKIFTSWQAAIEILSGESLDYKPTGSFYYFHARFNMYKPVYFINQL